MTVAAPHKIPAQGPAVRGAMLWPDGGRVDPSETIPQNRRSCVAPRPRQNENASVSDALSLTIWCPLAYHDRVQGVLAAFGAQVDADIKSSAGGPADFAAAANAPSLVFFDDLAGSLAATYGAQETPSTQTTRPMGDVVKDWRAQSEALLKAVRGAKAHITLIPAAKLLEQPKIVAQALAGRYGLALEGDLPAATSGRIYAQAPHFALMAAVISQTTPKIATLAKQLSKACPDGTADLPQDQTPDALQVLLAQVGGQAVAGDGAMMSDHDQDLRRVETLAQATIERLRDQIDEAKVGLLEREAQTTRLSDEAAQHDAAATYLREELIRREATYSAHLVEMGVLRASAFKLECSRKASSLKGNRLERDLRSLSRNLKMRDDRIAGLATALHGYEDEALGLRGEVEALRSEVDGLRRSTSWRLTAPVRAVSLLARRVLRRG